MLMGGGGLCALSKAMGGYRLCILWFQDLSYGCSLKLISQDTGFAAFLAQKPVSVIIKII